MGLFSSVQGFAFRSSARSFTAIALPVSYCFPVGSVSVGTFTR
jgi:hypothetical protein